MQCNFESPPASEYGSANPAAAYVLQHELEFRRFAKEFNNPTTKTKLEDKPFATRIRRHHLQEQPQQLFNQLKTTKYTAKANSSPLAVGTCETEPLETMHLCDKQKQIWKFLDEFKRTPPQKKRRKHGRAKIGSIHPE